MNAVEIEEAVTKLAEQPFDPEEFPFQFLEAFGNKEVTIKRLRKGDSNKSDIAGALLQVNNIHIAVAVSGNTSHKRRELQESKATTKHKAKFVLATDGDWLEAEELATGEVLTSSFQDLPNHFGFFLPLAGITTVQAIKDNPIDVRATSRLNKLYVELLNANLEWATEAKKPEMNHFMARLIFCFFAEDTHIFRERLFTQTVAQMSESSGENTAWVIQQCFEAMNIDPTARRAIDLKPWADGFPYVNGGLFSGSMEVPKFTKVARSYLLRAGELNWKEINPDIFGSMIQAVADDEERGALGMHYTSVPNILKVLNPLFLDDLRNQLAEAGNSKVKLFNLRKRIAHIRVFDPACGSGNFLVIAYKQMREIEAEINRRRGEPDRRSEIPIRNFCGIELRDFAAEVARLALVIAEYQSNLRHIGQMEAKEMFLPLQKENWITRGNALRLDWLRICPPTGRGVAVKSTANDLFETPLKQSEIDFENEGGETYICGNPPYLGSQLQAPEMKEELRDLFGPYNVSHGHLDYICGWFLKASEYLQSSMGEAAFVTTNSLCQGRIVPILWPLLFEKGIRIRWGHTSFKWANLASHNAGVTVAIVGICTSISGPSLLIDEFDGSTQVRSGNKITPYLTFGETVYVTSSKACLAGSSAMAFGSMANDGGGLIMSREEAVEAVTDHGVSVEYVRPFLGSEEYINGKERYCIWVPAYKVQEAPRNKWLEERFERVRQKRTESGRSATVELAKVPYRFGEVRQRGDEQIIIVPAVSSESREYLPVGLLPSRTIISNLAFALYDAPLWNMAIIASRLHLVWIGTVCGKLKTDFRYSNTLGWNTFPIPPLTADDKDELIRRAEDILLAREAHYPATIADLYRPDAMPQNLREAHQRNDETLERIYVGRKFKNDTERLEHLFDLYTKMTAKKK